MNAGSDFLVDNPIYKTSSVSLLPAENGRHAHSTTLRNLGSEDNSPTHSTSAKLTAADNPQYGTHREGEPKYKGSESNTDIASTGDPVYSIPLPVKHDSKRDSRRDSRSDSRSDSRHDSKRDSGVPLYESTMDIPTTVGTDGEYAKLNHNQRSV